MDNNQETNALGWESIEEKEIQSEMMQFVTNCNAVVKQLNVMVVNNECKKTEELMEQFGYGDLTSGWMSEFRLANQDSFSKYLNGSARPSWYNQLSPDKQNRYDMILQYYKDIVTLVNPCTDLGRILLDLVDRKILRAAFSVEYMPFNFGDADITEKTFKRIDIDARQVSDRINRSWGDIEGIAVSAKQFLESNRERMDYNTLKAGYQKARLQDYMDDFRNSAIADDFGVLSGGSFYVKAHILSKAKAIDKYTFKLAQSDDTEDVMKKLIEDCKLILNKSLIPNEKTALTETGGHVFLALRKLTNELITFAEGVVETFKLYKEGNPDESPYCFMKHPSAYGAIKNRYHLNPDKSDPWDKGTHFYDLFVMEAASLSAHCEEFVKKQGNVNYRD